MDTQFLKMVFKFLKNNSNTNMLIMGEYNDINHRRCGCWEEMFVMIISPFFNKYKRVVNSNTEVTSKGGENATFKA